METLTPSTIAFDEGAVQAFRDSIRGSVTVAGDPEYEARRHVYNGAVDRHPALIATVSVSDCGPPVPVLPRSFAVTVSVLLPV